MTQDPTPALTAEPESYEVHGRGGSTFRRGADGWYRLNRAFVPRGRPMTFEHLIAAEGPITLPTPQPLGSSLHPQVLQVLLDVVDGVVRHGVDDRGTYAVNERTGRRCTQAVHRAGGAIRLSGQVYEPTDATRDFVAAYRAERSTTEENR